jgi:hypothetical protein
VSLEVLREAASADIIGAAGVLAAAVAERVAGPVEGSKLLETEGYEGFGGINWYTDPAKKPP